MKHIMRVNDNAFEKMKKGIKKREYRVNDEKKQQIQIGDIIEFRKLSNPEEKILMDVKAIELYPSLETAFSAHFEEDFSDSHNDIKSAMDSFYQKGYGDIENINQNGMIVFHIKKHRIVHYDSTVCYLKKDNQVLMIKFTKKWDKVYAPPGGKFEEGESPLDCIMREYYEETGLTLINPRLQGLSFRKDASTEGTIFVYTAEDFEGELNTDSEEGTLEWVKLEDLVSLNQFEQNQKFTPYLFKDELFEGKYLLDENYKVLNYQIKTI